MKKFKAKRQPTRDDLASALHTIRDQSQIIALLARMIGREHRTLLKPDANKRPLPLNKSKANERRSSDRSVN